MITPHKTKGDKKRKWSNDESDKEDDSAPVVIESRPTFKIGPLRKKSKSTGDQSQPSGKSRAATSVRFTHSTKREDEKGKLLNLISARFQLQVYDRIMSSLGDYLTLHGSDADPRAKRLNYKIRHRRTAYQHASVRRHVCQHPTDR